MNERNIQHFYSKRKVHLCWVTNLWVTCAELLKTGHLCWVIAPLFELLAVPLCWVFRCFCAELRKFYMFFAELFFRPNVLSYRPMLQPGSLSQHIWPYECAEIFFSSFCAELYIIIKQSAELCIWPLYLVQRPILPVRNCHSSFAVVSMVCCLRTILAEHLDLGLT